MKTLINAYSQLKLPLGVPDAPAKEVVLTCRSKR